MPLHVKGFVSGFSLLTVNMQLRCMEWLSGKNITKKEPAKVKEKDEEALRVLQAAFPDRRIQRHLLRT